MLENQVEQKNFWNNFNFCGIIYQGDLHGGGYGKGLWKLTCVINFTPINCLMSEIWTSMYNTQ